jgi:HEAT repeat protein
MEAHSVRSTSRFPLQKRLCLRAVTATVELLVIVASAGTLYAETPEQQAWDMLRSGAKEKHTGTRTQAVRALRLLPHCPEAIEMAKVALKDHEREVRATAATALGEMSAKEAIPALKESLTDPKPEVVLAAARSLQLLDDPAGKEVFVEILVGERKPEGRISEEMDSLNTKTIVEFGVQEGLGFLPFAGSAYSAVKAVRKNSASTSRALAARELIKDTDPRIDRALVQAAISDKSWLVRASALLALAKRQNPEMLNAIVPALSDQNRVVRYTAAAVVIRLAKLGEPVKDVSETISATPIPSTRLRAAE